MTLAITELFKACREGRRDAIDTFLHADGDVECREMANGNTLLFVACFHGHLDVAQSLALYGANVRAENRADKSRCIQAAARHSRVLSWVLETDARKDVNYQDDRGSTALQQTCNISARWSPFIQEMNLALVEDRLRCIDLLVDAGADLNLRNSYGRTALIGAAHSGAIRLVQRLLAHGAEDLPDNDGRRAYDWAENTEVRRLLSRTRLRIVA